MRSLGLRAPALSCGGWGLPLHLEQCWKHTASFLEAVGIPINLYLCNSPVTKEGMVILTHLTHRKDKAQQGPGLAHVASMLVEALPTL